MRSKLRTPVPSKTFQFLALPLALVAVSCKAPLQFTPTNSGGAIQTVTASFLQTPSSETLANVPLGGSLTIQFQSNSNVGTPPTSPAIKSIRAYQDATCSTPAPGTLTYSLQQHDSEVNIANLIYSQSGDIFLGVSGSTFSPLCSPKIQVYSTAPAYFTITGPNVTNGWLGIAGKRLPNAITFQISDGNDNPVANARVKVGIAESTPSAADGTASLQLTLGSLAQDLTFITDNTNPYWANLSYGGQLIDSHPLPLNIVSDVGVALSIPTEDIVPFSGGATDPLRFFLLDHLGNRVHPSLWNFASAPMAYSDSHCVNAVSNDLGYQSLGSPILGTDPDTWFVQASLFYSATGTIYLKWSAASSDALSVSTATSSSCLGPLVLN